MDYSEILRKLKAAQRINVIGCTGSGKTTFSQLLAIKKNVSYVELDHLFWKDDWQETPDEELFPKLRKALDHHSFVLDGNYGRTQPIKWQNIDLVVWLNYPPFFVFRRLFTRSMQRAWDQKPMWGTNNHESFKRAFFSKDSILLWFLKSYYPLRSRYNRIFADEDYAHIEKLQIKSPAQADELLKNL